MELPIIFSSGVTSPIYPRKICLDKIQGQAFQCCGKSCTCACTATRGALLFVCAGRSKGAG